MKSHCTESISTSSHYSAHALKRSGARRIGLSALEAALSFGRIIRDRGAEIHVIGRKEISSWRHDGIDLRPFEGVQVVCAADGTVITVYRNRSLKGLAHC